MEIELPSMFTTVILGLILRSPSKKSPFSLPLIIMRIILLVSAFCLSLMPGCQKATPFAIDVSSITNTDAMGNIIGSPDNTDWTMDAEWSEPEKSFFRTDPVDLTGTSVAAITIQPAYPNPTQTRSVTFQFTASTITFLRIALVDVQLRKQSFYSFLTVAGLNAFHIPFEEAKFPANKNYRFYYSFEAAGSPMYFKGHGDITVR